MDTDAYGRFCRAMLERGVYPPPSQFEAWFPSLAHDDEAIEQTLTAAAELVRRGIRMSVLDQLAAELRSEEVIAPHVANSDEPPGARSARRRRPARRRGARHLPAPLRGDPRGLPPALRRAQAARGRRAGPEAPRGRLPVRARARAAGGPGRPRGDPRARRPDQPLRPAPRPVGGADGRPALDRGRRRGRGRLRRGPRSRQGGRPRRRPRSGGAAGLRRPVHGGLDGLRGCDGRSSRVDNLRFGG